MTFSTNLSEIFLILKRIQPDTITNVHGSSRKVPVTFVRFWWHFNFYRGFDSR